MARDEEIIKLFKTGLSMAEIGYKRGFVVMNKNRLYNSEGYGNVDDTHYLHFDEFLSAEIWPKITKYIEDNKLDVWDCHTEIIRKLSYELSRMVIRGRVN